MQRFPLSGATAVVTGAAGGIGRAFCSLLGQKGARVVGTDVHAFDLDQHGPEPVSTRVLDVTDPRACRELATEIAPDVWINNAGILGAGDVADQTGESVAPVIAVNLGGVVNGTLAAVASMRQNNRGRILNVGSFAAWTPAPGLAVYSGTKHGVRAFSVAAAAELAGTGISISVLCPEGVWTPMLHGAVHDGSSAMSFTARRLLDPAEVAAAGIDLLERGVLVGSLPRSRAVLARVIGNSGRAVVAMKPYFLRAGKAGQKRMRRHVGEGTEGAGAACVAPRDTPTSGTSRARAGAVGDAPRSGGS